MSLEIFEKYATRRFPADTIIFQEQDPGDVMYIILSGKVAITKRIIEELDKTLDVLEAGEYFGEMSLFLKTARTATARALEDTVLVEFTLDSFKQLLSDYLEVAINILIQLAQRLDRATSDAILLSLELELSKRKPVQYSPTGLLTEQVIVATGSFDAKDMQAVLRLRKELHWDRDTNVIASLIKPGQLHDALLYIIQTHDIHEVMKLTYCYKDLVRWNISLAVPAESEMLDLEAHAV